MTEIHGEGICHWWSSRRWCWTSERHGVRGDCDIRGGYGDLRRTKGDSATGQCARNNREDAAVSRLHERKAVANCKRMARYGGGQRDKDDPCDSPRAPAVQPSS